MERIDAFARSGRRGETLELPPTLSSLERRIVHELAEELGGLAHESRGTVGVDRRIVLTVLRERAVASSAMMRDEEEDEERRTTSAFAVLDDDDDDDESRSNDDDDDDDAKPASLYRDSNSQLKALAQERAEREKERQRRSAATAVSSSSNPKPKKKKKKKTPKGGSAKASGATATVRSNAPDNNEDGDDDMAFLDAQIDRNLTSHGRRVEGSGKNYRTIVNGILTERPAPREKPKDARSSAALRFKLQQAQEDRRAKSKKKKK